MNFKPLSKHFNPAFWICIGTVVLLAGCISAPADKPKKSPKPDIIYWPAPPELPRFKYETSLRTTSDFDPATNMSRLERKLTVGDKTREPAFGKPYAVAAHGGKIYVTDTVSRRVVVFDAPRRKIYFMGVHESGALIKPSGIALDDQMRVYVADVSAKRVNVYDNLGLFLYSVGNSSDLERPTGVAVSPAGDRIYVIDRNRNENMDHRVVVYDNKGLKLFVIGGRGTGEGQFNVPVQGAVAPDGTLYVLDAGNFRVQAFDRDGKFLRAWGKTGNDIGDFVRPRGIAVDNEGNVYVTDAAFGNVQIFSPKGELLLPVGYLGTEDRPGIFAMPGGVAVDETGHMYVVDQVFDKVDVFRRLSKEEGELIIRNSGK